MLDAYDKKTGELVAQLPMPGMQTGLPMTYMHNNRQFILVAVGAANGQGPQLVAYAIPAAGRRWWRQRWSWWRRRCGTRGACGGLAAPAAPAQLPQHSPAGGRGQRGARQ